MPAQNDLVLHKTTCDGGHRNRSDRVLWRAGVWTVGDYGGPRCCHMTAALCPFTPSLVQERDKHDEMPVVCSCADVSVNVRAPVRGSNGHRHVHQPVLYQSCIPGDVLRWAQTLPSPKAATTGPEQLHLCARLWGCRIGGAEP